MREDFDFMGNEKLGHEEDLSLVELWVLADKFDMPKLQNLALKSIDDLSDITQGLASSSYAYVYENTNEDSLLRHYFVAQCLHYIEPGGFREHTEKYPHEMLINIAEFSTVRFSALEDGEKEEAFDLNKYMVPVKE